MPFRLICEHIILSDFEAALDKYKAVKPGVILIHVMIDTKMAKQLIQTIKQSNPKCSVIVLTTEDLQESFSVESDEHIKKLITLPINSEEMIVALENSIDYDNLFYYINDNILFEPSNSSLMIDNQYINLTQKETELLLLLVKHRHRIVNYFEIDQYVWTNGSMSRNTLTSIVRNIRKKSNHEDIIINHSGQGYKLGK
jgi:DNA-binding response OmpR family regulator